MTRITSRRIVYRIVSCSATSSTARTPSAARCRARPARRRHAARRVLPLVVPGDAAEVAGRCEPVPASSGGPGRRASAGILRGVGATPVEGPVARHEPRMLPRQPGGEPLPGAGPQVQRDAVTPVAPASASRASAASRCSRASVSRGSTGARNTPQGRPASVLPGPLEPRLWRGSPARALVQRVVTDGERDAEPDRHGACRLGEQRQVAAQQRALGEDGERGAGLGERPITPGMSR